VKSHELIPTTLLPLRGSSFRPKFTACPSENDIDSNQMPEINRLSNEILKASMHIPHSSLPLAFSLL
jgi:hypothetical protein